MKAELTIKKEFDLKTLRVQAKVRYWEDSEINGESDTEDGNLIPLKEGDNWAPDIDIETGVISNWPKGTTADIHYKVCDCCYCELVDIDGNVVLEKDGYVPGTLSPKENGFGDYIIMEIDGDGKIKDWEFDVDDFIEDED